MILSATFPRTLLIACAVTLSGCASAPPVSSTPTPEPLPSPTPTFAFPTLIPTVTVTSVPSPTPSAGIAVDAGPILFQANFSPEEGWRLSSDADGGASLSAGSLVIAVSRPNASRYVIVPVPPVADFLLEARIRAGLCGAEDEIGLLFRVSPQEDHYRFTLDCQAEVRLTRVLGSSAAVLAGPLDAPNAIPGSPAENQIAILARGGAFTFFVNGAEVLRSHDPHLTSGHFGFFVRSASQGQTTAALTSLSVRALLPAVTATPALPPG
jgi:hypothetical protein